MITSQFFSLAYSHPPVGGFNPSEARREKWRQAGIDEHAHNHADRWVKRYQDYCDNILGRPNTTFLRYEDMVTDLPTWLERFIAPFPVARKEGLVRKYARKYRHNFDVGSEDVYRQEAPGHPRRPQGQTPARHDRLPQRQVRRDPARLGLRAVGGAVTRARSASI